MYFLLTCREGSNLAVHPSMSLTPTSKRGLITPHLFSLPFSSTTIFPDLWSSTYSNSPMYPADRKNQRDETSNRTRRNQEKLYWTWVMFNGSRLLTVLLHNKKKLYDHFWWRPNHDLSLSPLLSIVHALQGIIQNTDSHHLKK